MRMTLRHYVCSTRRKSRQCPGKSFLVRSLLARRIILSWFQRYGWKANHRRANLPSLSKICNHFWEIAAWSRKSLTMITVFWKKGPLRANFQKQIFERIHHVTEPGLVCKFREIWLTGNRQSGALFTWQRNKISARSPALASARIAPKICQTIYSKFPKFHPNPFTSGGVIAARVNIVETRHKVFPILGEASSASKNGHNFSST